MTKYDDMGFAPSMSGHALEEDAEQMANHAKYSNYDNWFWLKCTCNGLSLAVRPMKNGTAGSRDRREWTDHLDAACADPNEIILVGTITTHTKVPRMHELYVVVGTYTDMQRYLDGSSKRMHYWLSHDYRIERNKYLWFTLRRTQLVRHPGAWTYKIDSCYVSRPKALQAADETLRKADEAGDTITGAKERLSTEAVALKGVFSAADLVERAIAATGVKDAAEALSTLAEIDALFDALPILEGMRNRIRQHLRVKA